MKKNKKNQTVYTVYLFSYCFVRTAFDVLHHPLSFLLQSLVVPQSAVSQGLSLVPHLSCPCGFSLCVPSLCSTPARLVRSPQSSLTSSVCLHVFLLFCLCLAICERKKSRYINKIGDCVSPCALTPGVPPQLSRWSAVKQNQYWKHFTHRRLIVFADIRLEVIICYAYHSSSSLCTPVLGKTTTKRQKQKN